TARLVLGVDERQTVVATLGPSVKAIAGTDDRRRFTPASSTGGVRPPVEIEFPLFGPSGLEGKVVLMTPQSLSRVRTDGLTILASHIAIAVANVRLREEL